MPERKKAAYAAVHLVLSTRSRMKKWGGDRSQIMPSTHTEHSFKYSYCLVPTNLSILMCVMLNQSLEKSHLQMFLFDQQSSVLLAVRLISRFLGCVMLTLTILDCTNHTGLLDQSQREVAALIMCNICTVFQTFNRASTTVLPCQKYGENIFWNVLFCWNHWQFQG